MTVIRGVGGSSALLVTAAPPPLALAWRRDDGDDRSPRPGFFARDPVAGDTSLGCIRLGYGLTPGSFRSSAGVRRPIAAAEASRDRRGVLGDWPTRGDPVVGEVIPLGGPCFVGVDAPPFRLASLFRNGCGRAALRCSLKAALTSSRLISDRDRPIRAAFFSLFLEMATSTSWALMCDTARPTGPALRPRATVAGDPTWALCTAIGSIRPSECVRRCRDDWDDLATADATSRGFVDDLLRPPRELLPRVTSGDAVGPASTSVDAAVVDCGSLWGAGGSTRRGTAGAAVDAASCARSSSVCDPEFVRGGRSVSES
mmetsp:Transcript_772/g.2560  ORF Transcript_772/g.2560 Transcript_772/m.2560 type:complete len:314 (-) Transcript_772:523-1464(-)